MHIHTYAHTNTYLYIHICPISPRMNSISPPMSPISLQMSSIYPQMSPRHAVLDTYPQTNLYLRALSTYLRI